MKEVLQQYASYNLWANERLLNVASSLTNEQQQQEIESSFSSVYMTFLHMWDIESIWWQRLKMQEQIISPGASLNLTMQEIAHGLLNQSKQWEQWVSNANENILTHVFAYYNNKKEYFKNPAWQSILHLYNHQSYHRGQVVTMFHHLKVKKIPATDFIVWIRKK